MTMPRVLAVCVLAATIAIAGDALSKPSAPKLLRMNPSFEEAVAVYARDCAALFGGHSMFVEDGCAVGRDVPDECDARREIVEDEEEKNPCAAAFRSCAGAACADACHGRQTRCVSTCVD